MRIVLAVALACFAGPAVAAGPGGCPQARALYADAAGRYGIAFRPVGSASAVTSHLFRLGDSAGTVVLDGHVIAGGMPERPEGALLFDCPEGDATGAELDACRVWEGVVYAVGSDGAVGFLGTGEAAAQVLLPDLSRALMASHVFAPGRATAEPGDVFILKGCAA
ncbi:hypothetical protein [Ensifer soli]|uniref:hypothetical protein n=1 Tax=Ciceribacter sp. sgz301302 TaxID=3342379 RepID=UPI0035B70B52